MHSLVPNKNTMQDRIKGPESVLADMGDLTHVTQQTVLESCHIFHDFHNDINRLCKCLAKIQMGSVTITSP